jgi:hypothetical protein
MLVMLVPSYGTLAMACAAQLQAMRCMRHSASVYSAQPTMPCHHAMAQSKPRQSESSETSLQASDDGNCCQHHCCCSATTSEWAQPAYNLLSRLSLLIEPAQPTPSASLHSSDVSGHNSARAPPCV